MVWGGDGAENPHGLRCSSFLNNPMWFCSHSLCETCAGCSGKAQGRDALLFTLSFPSSALSIPTSSSTQLWLPWHWAQLSPQGFGNGALLSPPACRTGL